MPTVWSVVGKGRSNRTHHVSFDIKKRRSSCKKHLQLSLQIPKKNVIKQTPNDTYDSSEKMHVHFTWWYHHSKQPFSWMHSVNIFELPQSELFESPIEDIE